MDDTVDYFFHWFAKVLYILVYMIRSIDGLRLYGVKEQRENNQPNERRREGTLGDNVAVR